jgi:hypothetical protein
VGGGGGDVDFVFADREDREDREDRGDTAAAAVVFPYGAGK